MMSTTTHGIADAMSTPKAAPAVSFVLHAPLELMARTCRSSLHCFSYDVTGNSKRAVRTRQHRPVARKHLNGRGLTRMRPVRSC